LLAFSDVNDPKRSIALRARAFRCTFFARNAALSEPQKEEPMFRFLAALSGLAIASGCVTAAAYDAKVAQLESLRAQHDQASAQALKDMQSRVDVLAKQVPDLEQAKDEAERQLTTLTVERDALRKQLDDSTALAAQLKTRLEKLGENVDKLTGQNGLLSGSLAELKTHLDELRRQKEAADEAAATFRSLVRKFRSMIDAGQLKVSIRDGRMLIAMPNDVLFDSGRTEIKPGARVTLARVASVLSSIDNRHFVVAGHTDNVPIHTDRFASNWELSTGRAVEVVKFLIDHGLRPQVLAAAGYGEYDPVASNADAEHRALNRRIEIVLQPNLSELPSTKALMASARR
jgi:chemotaxis protein MotB